MGLYLPIVISPVLERIFDGKLFGGDIGQYLVSAHGIIYARDFVYRYPYPILPILYTPIVMLFTDPFIQYSIGCIVGPILLILLVSVTYLVLSSLYRNKNKYYQIISVLGCIPLAFYPLYFDAIGWGGQTQFLALIFGMLMIKFYVEHKFAFFMLTSTVLVLAHPWVASYFISIVLLDSIKLFVKRRIDISELRQVSVLSFARFTSYPIILLGLAYILLEGGGMINLYDISVIDAIIKRSIDLDLFIKRLVYSTEITFLLFFLVYLLLSLTILLMKGRNSDLQVTGSGNAWLFSATSIMVLVFIMLSPAQYADRGFYLLPISISFWLSELYSRFINDKFMASFTSKSEHKERNELFKLLFSMILLSTFLVGCYAGSAIAYYPSALDYYSIPKDVFDLHGVLKNTDGNVLFITPHALWFPTSGLLKTDVFVPTQPVWFIQNRQIHYVELSNMLTWGNVFARCGKVIVADSEPLWAQPSPAIFISDYPYFVELIRLSDGLLPVEWSPIDSPEINWTNSPFYSDSITSMWGVDQSQAQVYINHVYRWSSLVINKTILLFSNSTIEIKLRYIFLNSIPRSIEHQLIFLVMKNLGKDLFLNFAYYDAGGLAINVTQYFKEPWIIKKYTTLITIYSKDAIIEYLKHEDAGSWSFLRIRYKPFDINASSITITMKFNIHLDEEGRERCNLELTTRGDLIKQLNIRYIIVDKGFHEDSLHMVERDASFYRISEVGRYIIYRRNNVD